MACAGKVVLVFGGAFGYGASCVEELLQFDIKGIVIADRDNAKFLEQLRDQYGNDKVTFVKTDIVDKNSLESAFQETIKTYNNIDILVNAAGAFDEHHLERVFQVNLISTAQTCHLAISTYFPKYKTGGNSYIVNIASIAGIVPIDGVPHYVASKHGVVGLTRAYGEIVAKNGVCVMALCQGLTDVPLVKDINSSTVIYPEYLEKTLATLPIQKPEVVAKSLVKILQEPESASVWLINDSVLTKMDLPTLGKLKSATQGIEIC